MESLLHFPAEENAAQLEPPGSADVLTTVLEITNSVSAEMDREEIAVAYVDALRGLVPARKFVLRVLSPDTGSLAWSLEGRLYAIESVYLDGTLQGGATQGSAPSLPAGYATAAKSLAERQVVLAGYRLADLLVKFAITA